MLGQPIVQGEHLVADGADEGLGVRLDTDTPQLAKAGTYRAFFIRYYVFNCSKILCLFYPDLQLWLESCLLHASEKVLENLSFQTCKIKIIFLDP